MIKMSMEEIVPLLKEVIESGANFRLYPHGQSMLPTLKEGEDSVLLSNPNDIRVGDIVLYRRENGQYVLHRAVKLCENHINMCGDNQFIIEKNVPASSVIAKVVGIYKKDKFVDVRDKEYRKNVRKIYRKKPFQRFSHKLKSRIYPSYKQIVKK